MQPRRHRSVSDNVVTRIRSGAEVTLKTYAKRYGVDRFTAYDDLTALGFTLPAAARQWAQRPAAAARVGAKPRADPADDDSWILMEGREYFVVGYTTGGAPYGVFADEMS
jgi:hypothetical protein